MDINVDDLARYLAERIKEYMEDPKSAEQAPGRVQAPSDGISADKIVEQIAKAVRMNPKDIKNASLEEKAFLIAATELHRERRLKS